MVCVKYILTLRVHRSVNYDCPGECCLRRTVCDDIDWRFDNLSRSHHQSQVNCESSWTLYVSGHCPDWLNHSNHILPSSQPITAQLNWQMTNNITRLLTNQDNGQRLKTSTDDSQFTWLWWWLEFPSVCQNTSQCHHKQSLSGLHSSTRSYFTDPWYDSWVQTIYSIKHTCKMPLPAVISFNIICWIHNY